MELIVPGFTWHYASAITITAPVPDERLCPVAAIFVQTRKVTFGHRISR